MSEFFDNEKHILHEAKRSCYCYIALVFQWEVLGEFIQHLSILTAYL